MTHARVFAHGLLALAACLFAGSQASGSDDRPNILWIIVDDMSANFSCYGETLIETPHLDQLAAEGIRFTNAYVTAPVCSPNRSAFITGMYQTSIGAHHHRSGRGPLKIHLPEDVRPVPELFQEAGYYTTITGWPNQGRGKLGKTDYNFEWNREMYDGADWSERAAGQPFFAQIQLPGGKHRGGTRESARKFANRMAEKFGAKVDPNAVTLPPYYPRNPVLLEDWAAYLDSVRLTDAFVGEILARLKADGDAENTVVVFMTDHGISHARGKQFLYDEGLHVPLVMAGPGLASAAVRDDLVEHIDITATSLALAGIEIPASMQSRDLLSETYQPRQAVFAARDRCDETVDHIRSLRTDRFKYIRNFLPERPALQPNRYKDGKSILIALREAHAAGTLDATQELLFAATRPAEELYDLHNDPFELHNLAADPAWQPKLRELREQLDTWIHTTHDQGAESAAMYDSDMAAYRNPKAAGSPREEILEKNIALMKRWAAEGK